MTSSSSDHFSIWVPVRFSCMSRPARYDVVLVLKILSATVSYKEDCDIQKLCPHYYFYKSQEPTAILVKSVKLMQSERSLSSSLFFLERASAATVLAMILRASMEVVFDHIRYSYFELHLALVTINGSSPFCSSGLSDWSSENCSKSICASCAFINSTSSTWIWNPSKRWKSLVGIVEMFCSLFMRSLDARTCMENSVKAFLTNQTNDVSYLCMASAVWTDAKCNSPQTTQSVLSQTWRVRRVKAMVQENSSVKSCRIPPVQLRTSSILSMIVYSLQAASFSSHPFFAFDGKPCSEKAPCWSTHPPDHTTR